MKIAVLSDPHLGSEKPTFVPNWDRVVAHVNARDDIALAVALGDLTLDGVILEADRLAAKSAIEALQVPVLVLPGNHDVGDIARTGHHPVTEERQAAWVGNFGPTTWHSDAIEGWRLVGINSQLIGSGLPEEDQQWAEIEIILSGRGNRVPVLFTHMPLFLEQWDEVDRPAWALPREGRLRLRTLIDSHGVVAVVSAHMHRVMQLQRPGEPSWIWTAASSFLTRDSSLPPQPGSELLGYTVLELKQSYVTANFVAVEGMLESYIEDYNGTIYRSPSVDD